MTRDLRPQTYALIALAIGVLVSLTAWFLVGRQVDKGVRVEFATQAGLAANLVERRIQRYVDLLFGMEAFMAQGGEVKRPEFNRHVAALRAGQRFPGVQALQFVRRVPGAERAAFETAVRNDRSLLPEGYPGFAVKPPSTRPEHWVIDFVEPLAGNEPAFGLDLATLPVPRQAVERARDTGEPTSTGRYRLAQEKGSSYGLVIYLPVYATPNPRTVAQRRLESRGWVNVVVRVDDVFADTLSSPVFSGMRLEMHDVGPVTQAEPTPPSEATTFYRLDPLVPASATNPPMATSLTHDAVIPVAGRQWQLRFASVPPVANPWLRPLPLLTLVAGLVISLLLYGILRTLARTRSEALEMARTATRELRGQLSFNQQLLEAIPYPVYFKDAKGVYLGCNRAFETQLGVTREKLVGLTAYDIMPARYADRLVADDNRLLQSGTVGAMETRAPRPSDGMIREAIFNKAPLFNADGEVTGLVGIVVDITERKALEAETRESHGRLDAVIKAVPLAIIARDMHHRITMWNPSAERLFGWKEHEVLGTETSIVPPHLVPGVTAYRERIHQGEVIFVEETQRMHRDGTYIDVAMSLSPLQDGDGGLAGTMVTITDLRPRKAAEQALRESEARLKLAMEAAHMGLWYWDAANDDFTYSDGLNTLFGRAANAPATGYRTLQEALHEDDVALLNATLRRAVKQGKEFLLDYRVVWPDGSVHWVTNRGEVHRGADGRALRIVGIAMDITERKLAEQRIAHMAHHDALTGLPNRVLMQDRIRQAIAHAHRTGSHVAVLFIDLDRFKNINDSLGHALGDRLLQSVASRILACLREGDTVSRLGGDEFVIVIPGIEGPGDASTVAAKILEVLGASFHLQGQDLHVSASIGISLYPEDGSDAETLTRHADTAMYHAKDTGRGNFQFFTPHMNAAAQQRLVLENALRRALDNDEFELHYQPLFDLRDRSITGMEALLRWHPKGGEPVPPSVFIEIAEESGLIVPIGEWALGEALRQAKAWQGVGRTPMIAVNVSAVQLSRPNFLERLRRMLQDTGLDPALVELEVTERLIVEGAGEARSALDQVAALGVGIAIDDFGTGYSGLAYLKRLPIDTVKIDQSFVRDLTIDPDDAAIVTAILAMARSLGIDVVAEGVETEGQLEALQRLGCHRAQGYFLARPMTAAAATRLLCSPPASAAAD